MKIWTYTTRLVHGKQNIRLAKSREAARKPENTLFRHNKVLTPPQPQKIRSMANEVLRFCGETIMRAAGLESRIFVTIVLNIVFVY